MESVDGSPGSSANRPQAAADLVAQLEHERARVRDLERRLREAEEAVRSTRERFQLAMDNIPQSIWWKDRECRYLGCNRAFAEAAGWSPEEIVGKTDFDLAWTRAEAEHYRACDFRVMADNRPEFHILETLQRSDGRHTTVDTNKIPLHDADGRVIGVLGTYEDVTERIQMQEELRRHRDRLEVLVEERTRELAQEVSERLRAEEALALRAADLAESNRALQAAEKAKNEFFANVSHELRTPLTLILAPLESILSDAHDPLPGRPRKTLETMYNNAMRLLEMVNGLLDFARLEAGHVEVERQPVDCEAVVRSVLHDFASAAEVRAHRLSCRFTASSSRRLVDPYLLERILFNLLGNALKFTPDNGQVGVDVSGPDDELVVCVWDTGIGIAAEDRARLFERFQQGESSSTRRFEGTGLGLAMVRDFARLMGGDVEVESQLDRGSRFTVRLQAPVSEEPVMGDRRHAPASIPLKPEAAVHRGCGQRPLVLVAEDNPELGAFIGDLLEPHYDVTWVRDGEQALESATTRRPDIVISDVMMPRCDGLTLCRALKATPALSSVPVVLLTAHTLRRSLLQAWEAGADEYLFKPFHPVELTTRIRSLLSACGQRRQLEDERRAFEARAYESQRLEALGRMAGGVAHDFNNLLLVVHGNLDIATAEAGPAAGPFLQEASEAVERAAELTRQMLLFAGLGRRQETDLDLAALVDDTLPLARRAADRAPELQLRLEPAPVRGDAAQLRQVVMNLLMNAMEAVPEGRTPHLRLTTGTDESQDAQSSAYLQVEDDGSGMDEATQKKMFDPFFSTRFVGRGLGLATVQGIVRSHAGRVEVESTPDHGTKVRVVLPAARRP